MLFLMVNNQLGWFGLISIVIGAGGFYFSDELAAWQHRQNRALLPFLPQDVPYWHKILMKVSSIMFAVGGAMMALDYWKF